MKILQKLYTSYAVIIFALLCLIFIPLLVLLCQRKSWHPFALKMHCVWSHTFFRLVFIPVQVDYRQKLDSKKQYIFCANHFSYMDIPAMLLVVDCKFIGKSSLAKIPIFGYFYRKIHITVDRSSMRSRALSLQNAKIAADEGFKVAFFPEGGVRVKKEDIPYMTSFRDGAFRLSVDKKIPIVPITLAYDYKIFPGGKPFALYRHPCKIVVGEPIIPKENTETEIRRLRETTFQSIQTELDRHHPDKVDVVN